MSTRNEYLWHVIVFQLKSQSLATTSLWFLVVSDWLLFAGFIEFSFCYMLLCVFFVVIQTWRAVRLIVDTGLHSRGLTRLESDRFPDLIEPRLLRLDWLD